MFHMQHSHPTTLTVVIKPPVDVELAPRRCEPVAISRGRGSAGCCGGEVRPGHGGGVVDVQVLEVASCAAGGGVWWARVALS